MSRPRARRGAPALLHIHRSERADGLVRALSETLVEPPADPFTPEVISVPTRGIERWLAQCLSSSFGANDGRSDGVCANIDFPFPHRLIGDALAAASGVRPHENPWLPERACWPLLDLVDRSIGESWLSTLAAHLGVTSDGEDDIRRGRRLSSVRRLAELYDRYALHRPEMLRAWAENQDVDAAGRELSPDSTWQPELWRRLRDQIGPPSAAEFLETACDRLRAEPDLAGLPDRLSLFGLTRLPAAHLDVLRALAEHREAHLFLLHPSPGLWGRVDAATRGKPRIVRRADDESAALPTNPLLASWGRDAREMQLVLATRSAGVEHHHPVERRTGTLLAEIQAAVREDRAPAGVPMGGQTDDRALLDSDDRSIEIHACHGRARQVEVLRDVILHLLEEDPTLEPRDVIAMCPDIEMFAPLIQATFGAGETIEGVGASSATSLPDLRVRLADRSLRQTNPVLGVLAELIELAGQRLTVSQVLDLADRVPVRRRFRFDDSDLTRLQEWAAQSGIRWALDAAHRTPFKLEKLEAGTWRSGLDRILVGVAMTEDSQRLFNGVLPLDDVESGAIDLVGRFAEFVDRLRAALNSFEEAKTVTSWAEALTNAAQSLAATTDRDAWQHVELQRLLKETVAATTVDGAGNPTTITLPELRALLADRLRGRPTRANFRTGHLTICTLVPMRSVPHRVVCLLGLDDGVFPRKSFRDGDDLMLDDPQVGDRDPRSEDRQMLLDALLAAEDRLILTYSGNDERTNAPRPPAVPVGELLDVIDATARPPAGEARNQVMVRHPLQPFDPRNFVADELMPGRVWSFDTVALKGARALIGPRKDAAPFLSEPLPALDSQTIEIENLVRFTAHPVKAFLRRRLGISLAAQSHEVDEALSIELDALERWGVGQRLLEARLARVDLETAVDAESARGSLPPGVLGERVIEIVSPIVERITAEANRFAASTGRSESITVRVDLRDGRRLTGTVPDVNANVLLAVSYSSVSAKQRLAAWVRLLAVSVAHPERAFEAVTVGRTRGSDLVTIAHIKPIGATAAAGHLSTLVDLFDRGMREPLPLYCATSTAYAEAATAGEDPLAAAANQWASDWNFAKEDADLEHQLVLGGIRTIEDLLVELPRADENGPGWDARESSRFGRYARRMSDGLRSCEELMKI